MKGIIFKDEMVRAILEGRKTMTRRPMKLKDFMPSSTRGYDWEFRDKRMLWHSVSTDRLIERYAPYKPGEVVYVKETWQEFFQEEIPDGRYSQTGRAGRRGGDNRFIRMHVVYRADGGIPDHPEFGKALWRPSTRMPELASRIKLRILSVGVERIQEITPNDCISEGAWMVEKKELGRGHEAVEAFAHLWRSIYPGSWWRNDWIWKFEFEVTK